LCILDIHKGEEREEDQLTTDEILYRTVVVVLHISQIMSLLGPNFENFST